MANTGAPLHLEYLEDNEQSPHIVWRRNMDIINGAIDSGYFDGLERDVVSVSTSSLSEGQQDASKSIPIGKGGIVYEVSTNKPAFVIAYVDNASRVMDEGRDLTTDPISGAGVILEAEIMSPVESTLVMSPPASYWNNEYPVTNNIPIRVINKDESTGVIEVTFKFLKLEP